MLGYYYAAAAIAYDAGLSLVNVRTITVGELQGNRIRRDRTKTGRTVDLELWPETLEWIEAYHKELGIAQMPGSFVVRSRRGRPFTKDMLATDIHQVHEKLGIPSELKLANLRRTAWTETANTGATVPELAASAGWSMDTAGKNMGTYVVTSGPLADEGHNLRGKNIKGTEK